MFLRRRRAEALTNGGVMISYRLQSLEGATISGPTVPVFQRNQFRKSSSSGQNPQACVEVARGQGWVAVRDSKQTWGSPDDHRLVFTAEQFDNWLAALNTETPGTVCIEITPHSDHFYVLRDTSAQDRGYELRFTDAEIGAFLEGARNGEFSAESTAM
jgi:Domain of unknown function (DUF397)